MEYLDTFVVALCGSGIGAIVGIGMPSQAEQKSGTRGARWQIFSDTSSLGIILNEIIPLVVVGVIVAIIGVSILRLGGTYPLSVLDRYILATSFLVGAVIGKWMRYRRWKRRRRVTDRKHDRWLDE